MLDRSLTRSVSVVIFSGIRLSITIRNGRMSCLVALELSMTKMFSFFSNSMAGSLSGNLSGIINCMFFICKVNKFLSISFLLTY